MQAKLSLLTLAVLSFSVTASGVSPLNLPRSLAMGGTGVAVGDVTTASTHNPAVLSSTKVKHGFSVVIPSLGVGISDPDNFSSAIDDFQDGDYVDNLDGLIEGFPSTGDWQSVVDATDALNGQLQNLSGKELMSDLSVGGMVALPGRNLGLALTGSVGAVFGGYIDYSDSELLGELSNEIERFGVCGEANLSAPGSCDFNNQQWQYVNPNTGEIDFNHEEDLTSSVRLRGVALAEVGLSISTSFDFFDKPFAIGVTPKIVHARTFDYLASVNESDLDDFTGDDYISEHSNFNIDAGVLYELTETISLGLSGKNLIKQAYSSSRHGELTDYVVEVEPRYRAGLAYQTSWFIFAVDADLNKTKSIVGADSQLVAAGAEINAFNFAQVRFGYQHDLKNADNSTVSAGLGLSPFGIHVDLGVAGNADQVAGSLQLGLKW